MVPYTAVLSNEFFIAKVGLNSTATQLESPYRIIYIGLSCTYGSTTKHSTILITISIPKDLANASLAGIVLLLNFDLLAAIILSLSLVVLWVDKKYTLPPNAGSPPST